MADEFIGLGGVNTEPTELPKVEPKINEQEIAIDPVVEPQEQENTAV